jgi:tetratricopeptide (TPR) repeat protein
MKFGVSLSRLLPSVVFISASVLLCSCARSPAQRYAKFFEAGKAQLNKHDYARAVLQFRNAVQANPKSADAYYQLALAYLGAKDVPTAVTCLRKTLELNPKHTAAELKFAELAVATREPAELQEAEKHTRQVLKDSPANTDALEVLAQAEWQLGKRQEAEKLLSQAFAQSPRDLKASVGLAQIRIAKKDLAGAEAVLKKLAAANPNAADGAVILGRFYAAGDRAGDAKPQFERALKLDPQNGEALVSLAGIQWQAGKTDDAERLYKQAAALPDAQYQAVHAIFLFQTGKRNLAISEFEKLYKLSPTDRPARTRLILAYEGANRAPDAEKVIAAALKKNPKDIDALLEESAIYLRKGNTAPAETALTTALHFQPDSAQAHYLLATVRQMKNQPELQKQELTQALQSNPGLLAARLQMSEWLIAHKGAEEARHVLSETPESQKSDLAVLIQSNWAALALGDGTAARSGIDRVLSRDRQPDALLQDATLKVMERDYTGARRSLEEALQKSPDNLDALSLMVQSYQLQKQLPAAVQWLRDYSVHRPHSAPVEFELGRVLTSTGDSGGARIALQTAKAADPKLTSADLILAQLDLQDGKLDEARKRVSGVISQKPADVPAHLLLGNVEQTARNYQAAIEQYRKAVELDEGNIEALNNLAYALAEYAKQPDEALKFAQKAGELAPDNAGIADTLGWVLYRNALYTSALPYLERAASQQPTGLRKCHLALAYLKSGNEPKGQKMLTAALQMDPSLSRSDLSGDIALSQHTAR